METPVLIPTRRGRATLWLAGVLVTVGVFRFDAVLVLLGTLLASLVPVARLWARLAIRAISVDRRLPASAFAGALTEVRIQVGNRGRRIAARDVTVSVVGRAATTGQVGFAFLAPLELVECRLHLRAPARGRHRGGGWTVVSRFPGGLVEARVSGRFDDQWLVYPAPSLPRSLEAELERARMERLLRWRLQHEATGEFHGIRAYQVGDPVKAIHWPASARTGRLMARQWDPPAPRPGRVGVIVHSLSPRQGRRLLRSSQFEAALRVTSGLLFHFQQEGVSVSYAAGFDDWRLRQAPDGGRFADLFEALAVARRRGESSTRNLASRLRAMAASCERIFVVGDSPLDAWASRVQRLVRSVPLVCISGDDLALRQPSLPLKLATLEKRPGATADAITSGSGMTTMEEESQA